MIHHNYVRRQRRLFALSQDELGLLLGLSGSAVSRLESDERPVPFETALSLQVVFGQSPRALFPEHYQEVEEAVMARAAELDRAIGTKSDPWSKRKRVLLVGMTHRAKGGPGR